VPRTPQALRSRSFRADRIAWAVFLVGAVSLTAGTRAWLHRRVRNDGIQAGGTLDFRLPVLAYDRVAQGPGGAHFPAERLAEHLEALRAAGFEPVSLRRVAEAYQGESPLPERPVLLTFDGGHLSTYETVDPLLRALRWPAVMFVDTRLQERRDATYVYWDRLQRMVDSGVWDLGSMGQWPEDANAVERELRGQRVLAVARGAAAGPPAAHGAAPLLAFENGVFGVNGARTDRQRLVRIHAPASWTGRELVERLTSSMAAPRADPDGAPLPVPTARWVAGLGRVEVAGDGLVVRGEPRAEAWLAGGEWAGDFELEAEISPHQGVFWIVQQASRSRDQWRWGGTERTLYLEILRAGAPVHVLWQADLPFAPGSWHTVRVVKRGRGVWVEWDGRPLAGMPRVVPGRWDGYVGISTGTASEPGALALRNVRFAAVPYRVRAVSASPPQAEVQALLAEAPRIAAISPPALVQQGSALERRQADADVIAMVAARGAWDVLPTVQIADARLAADPSGAARLADLASSEGWAGLRLDGSRLPPAALETWRTATPEWQRAFARRALRLVLDPPRPGEARP